ncbi:hypothetical protein [Caldiplasma sukawensis]
MNNSNFVDFIFGKRNDETKSNVVNKSLITASVITLLGSLIVLENFFLLTSFLNYNQQTGYQGIEDISIYYPVRTILLIIGLILSIIGFTYYDYAVKKSLGKLPLFRRATLYLLLGFIAFFIFVITDSSLIIGTYVCNELPGSLPYISPLEYSYLTILYFVGIFLMAVSTIALTYNLFNLARNTGVGILAIVAPFYIVPYLNLVAPLVIIISEFIIVLRE